MSFAQGLSGLNAAAKNLEIIGNNVSNSGTVGFKTGSAQFSDIFVRSVSERSSTSVGRGTNLDAIVQNFTQGAISPTNNPLDMAINGKGFFKMKTPAEETIYTRNGQFSVDAEGFIQGANGFKLMGFPYDLSTGQISGLEGPIRFPQQAIAPKASTEVSMQFNLDSRKGPIDADIPFEVDNLDSFSHTLAATVYDQLGEDHSLAAYFRKVGDTATTSEYEVYLAVDGRPVSGTTFTKLPQNLVFEQDGKLRESDPISLDLTDFVIDEVGTVFGSEITLDFENSTNYGSAFGVNNVRQNGYESAALASFSVTSDGVLRGRYSNGQTQNLAQIAIVTFRNPDGLRPVGSNAYVKTANAGTEFQARDDDTASTTIQSGALEAANLDLTNELVNIITAQRIYQANAQTVKAQDNILQTLVNLR